MSAALLMALAYVIWRPVSNGAILYPTLAVMSAAAGWLGFRHRLRPNRRILTASYLLLLAVMFGILIGSIRGVNAGLGQQAIQWVGTIVVWSLFAYAFTETLARKVMRTTTLAIAFSALQVILYIGSQRGLPFPHLPDFLIQEQSAGYSSGLDAPDGGIRWLGLSTLAIGAPLMVTAAILGPDGVLPRRRVTIPVAALCILAAIFAGRRGILVVTLVAPFLAMIIYRALTRPLRVRHPIRIHPAFVYVAPLAVLAVALGWENEAVVRARTALADVAATYLTGRSGMNTLSADDVARVQQSALLLEAWSDSPILGQGLGATLKGFARSETRPWTFELQYHVLLFNLGIVGALLVAAGLLLAGRELRSAAVARPDLIPAMAATATGAISLLIANASNPYLQAVGHGWGIGLAAGLVTAAQRSVVPAPPPRAGDEVNGHGGADADSRREPNKPHLDQ